MLFAHPQDGLALDPLLILFAALLVDALVGDMKPLFKHVPHPVELVGRAIAWFDRRLERAYDHPYRIGAQVESLPVQECNL